MFYIICPQSPNILKVSKTLFKNLKNNKLEGLEVDILDILKQNKIVLEKSQNNLPEVPYLTLKLTSKCNFNCVFCSQKNLHSEKDEMDWDTAKISLDKYLKLNQDHYNLGFFGGEPLLRIELIKKIISYVEKEYPYKKVTYEINTNGFLLEKNIELVDRKNMVLAISVRGDKNYYIKNKELIKYNKISEVIKNFKNKQNLILNIVVESTNINYLENLIKEFSDIGIKDFALCIPSFSLGSFWNHNEKMFAKLILNLFKKCDREGFNLIFSDWAFWSDGKYNCRALSGTSIYIDTNGNANLCHSIDQPLGNIKKDKIENLVVNPKKFPKHLKEEIDFCDKCKIKNFCRGGCLADKKLKRKEDKIFCNFAKEFFKLYIDYTLNKK